MRQIITSDKNITFIDVDGKTKVVPMNQVWYHINEDTVTFLLIERYDSEGICLFTTLAEDLQINGSTYTIEQLKNGQGISSMFSPTGLIIKLVDVLPSSGDDSTIYLMANDKGSYTEYLWIKEKSKWEELGDLTKIDLTNYFTKDEINEMFAGVYTKDEVDALFSDVYNALEDKQDKLTAGDGIEIDENNVISSTVQITVDSALSATSTNPVENKVIDSTLRDYGSNVSYGLTNFHRQLIAKKYPRTNWEDILKFGGINGKPIASIPSENAEDFQLVEKSDVTTSLSDESTDTQVPSAKAVYDAIQEASPSVDFSKVAGLTGNASSGYTTELSIASDSSYLDRLISGIRYTNSKIPADGSTTSSSTKTASFYVSSINGVRAISNDYNNVAHFELPTKEEFEAHTGDTVAHTTQEEKDAWNAKQDALTAGEGITIENGVISASGGSTEETDPVFTAWENSSKILAGKNSTTTSSCVLLGADSNCNGNNGIGIGRQNKNISSGTVIGNYNENVGNAVIIGGRNKLNINSSSSNYSSNLFIIGNSVVDYYDSDSTVRNWIESRKKLVYGTTSLYLLGNISKSSYYTEGKNPLLENGYTVYWFGRGSSTVTALKSTPLLDIKEDGSIYIRNSDDTASIRLQDYLGGGGGISGITMNGSDVTVTSGVADLGTVVTDVSDKQDTLVSGTNIKTINNQSILGEGNITIEGGGASYTAGDGIEIDENNVITNTREQRVLIDEDDDSGLHSGFIVKSPHWRHTVADYDFGTWTRVFTNNIPVENADPYTQAGYLTNDRMKFTLKELVFDESQTPAYIVEATDQSDYISINGVVVPSDSTISITNTESDFVLKSGDVIITDESGFSKISYLISNEIDAQYLSYDSIVTIDDYNWLNVNSAYVVHSGQESQLADSSSVATLVRNSVGQALVSTGSTTSGTDLGKYTDNQLYIYPDADISYPGTSTIYDKSTHKARIANKLTNPDKNLTVGFDQTYNEQQTVTYYAYDGGIEALDFFGSSVYGGDWYGSQHTFVEKLNDEYYIDIPLDNLTANLTYPNCLRLYADTMDGMQREMYLTIQNNQLIAGTTNGYEFNDEMSGQYIYLNEMMAFVVNGQKITIGSSDSRKVLISDISNLTSLGIMPTSTGNGYINNGFMCYLQGSSSPAEALYRQLTLWSYEGTGTVTAQYQNHPEKLNHYIRYAGETGTAVGNRKAYILTDKNISQSDYIQALEARIAALETAVGNISSVLDAINGETI